MKAMTRLRWSRAIRFGAFGGALGLICFGTLGALFVGLMILQRTFEMPDARQIGEMAKLAAVWFSIPCAFFALIGAATASVSARIWGWRLVGVATVLFSLALGVWGNLTANPDVIGRITLLAVPIVGTIIGLYIILSAKRQTMESI